VDEQEVDDDEDEDKEQRLDGAPDEEPDAVAREEFSPEPHVCS
jgi:hypothetical protein